MANKETLEEELTVAKRKTAKPMLWVSMISMVMFFAGLTSAYLISMKRDDWVTFDLPQAFFTSTLLIIVSSTTLFLSQLFIKRNKRPESIILLAITFMLGLLFIWQQYEGFHQLKEAGLYFTGEGSTVSASFLIGISLMHALHVMAGIIVLLVILFNHFRHKYTAADFLGFQLGAIFWHFVGALWTFLFLFFYFIRK